jgi:hypothetical protein
MLALVVVTLVAVSTAAFSIGGTGHTRRAGTNAAVLVSRPAAIIMKMAKIDDNVGGIAASNNSLNFASSILDKIFNNQLPFSKQSTTAIAASEEEGRKAVESYIASLNSRMDTRESVREYFTHNVEYIDASSFYTSIVGTEALIRHCYLHAGSTNLLPSSSSKIVIDNIVASSTAVCLKYHLATVDDEIDIADTIGIVFCNLKRDDNSDNNKLLRISRLFNVGEPTSPKPGNSGLQLLRFVSKFINANEDDSKNKLIDDQATTTTTTTSTTMSTKTTKKNTIVEQYFEAWNARNMTHAASLFTTNCQMYDLQYNTPFTGREAFTAHLLNVNECLPNSFNFVVDDIIQVANNVGVRWHVENGNTPLQFTRGCSFYILDSSSTELIQFGYEIPEKAPPKLGYVQTILSKFGMEPIRIVPAIVWVAYMYILFISDGILPGMNALALEQRTWEEVRDLSINFWFISPILHLPFSPIVHPMLEGVFNLLLAWAAMFAGFLSDERTTKPNLLPLGPMLLGMQFLTSGFLLPYLFTRTSETIDGGEASTSSLVVFQEDITGAIQSKVAESKILGLVLGGVGTSSIVWGLFARQSDFGTISERYTSFLDLLSIDRVGSSFIVDLVIFAIFQSWFIDDDLRRRGVNPDDKAAMSELSYLRNSAKFVPFFGLVTYLTYRPPLKTRERNE